MNAMEIDMKETLEKAAKGLSELSDHLENGKSSLNFSERVILFGAVDEILKLAHEAIALASRKLGCIFCDFKAENLQALKVHSATCENHPLFDSRKRVRVWVARDTNGSCYIYKVKPEWNGEAFHYPRGVNESSEYLEDHYVFQFLADEEVKPGHCVSLDILVGEGEG